MSKAFLTVLLLGATASMWVAWARARQAASPPLPAPEVDPTDRVAVARVERAKIIEDKYRAVAVQYPGEIFVRWLKQEAVVELWARNRGRRFRLVAAYPILASSG